MTNMLLPTFLCGLVGAMVIGAAAGMLAPFQANPQVPSPALLCSLVALPLCAIVGAIFGAVKVLQKEFQLLRIEIARSNLISQLAEKEECNSSDSQTIRKDNQAIR